MDKPKPTKRLKQIENDLKWFRSEKKRACCCHKSDFCEQEIYELIRERREIKRGMR